MLLGVMVAPQARAVREITVTRTNQAERWITNLVEVNVPLNRFVEVFTTNVWDRFVTNTVSIELTNTIPVTAYRTNVFDMYSTNLVNVTATNVIPVTAYRTNVQTFNLTNFETVLVIQTNWVKATVTNVAVLSMPAPEPAATSAAVDPATVPVASRPAVVISSTKPGAIVVSALATGKSSVPRHAEVKLTAAWRDESTEPMNVLQWKVESDTTSIMAYSQGREFKREMPFGTYRVEIKATRGSAAAVLIGKGVLKITSGAVELAESPARMN
jgi:hypothetical protein